MNRPLRYVPRGPRTELEGGIHHVFTRGDHKEAIFDDDRDRRRFLRRYRDIVDRYEWVPLTYCLMGNHVHLVFETPGRTLGHGCRDLFGLYARQRNGERDTLGHVFQSRFKARLALEPRYFAQLLRYVALNPVKAGISRSAEAWPWSAHRTLLAGDAGALARSDRVSELLEVWGGAVGERYAALFEPGNAFALQYGSEDPGTWRPELATLFENGEEPGLHAARSHGYRLAQIAAHLGMHESTVSRRLRKKGA